jgi:hypothetical protein
MDPRPWIIEGILTAPLVARANAREQTKHLQDHTVPPIPLNEPKVAHAAVEFSIGFEYEAPGDSGSPTMLPAYQEELYLIIQLSMGPRKRRMVLQGSYLTTLVTARMVNCQDSVTNVKITCVGYASSVIRRGAALVAKQRPKPTGGQFTRLNGDGCRRREPRTQSSGSNEVGKVRG